MVKYAATVALLALSVLCVTATYSLVHIEKHLSNTLLKLNDEREELHRLTLEAGLTAMEARKASKKEAEYLDTWNTEITQTLTSVNATLQAAQASISSMSTVSDAAVSTLKATQQTVTSLQTPILSANQALTAATASIKDLDKLLQDPQFATTIAHTDATMSHVDATTADVQQAVHSYLHPTWPQRVLGWVKTGVVTVGQIIF
jgi:chromosome segregation ATPase